MKKYIAFFLAPLAAVFFITAIFQGPSLIQHLDSLTGVSQAFLAFSEYLITLAPAAFMAMIIGIPVFYLLRWIIHWKLWSCLLGALLVVGSVSLLVGNYSSAELLEIISGQQLLAILIGTVSYGTVFWLLMEKYWDEDEEE
jgi:hypothetical protein